MRLAHDTPLPSYSAPQTSYSAYIAPSDHKVPSLTYTFPLTQEADTQTQYEVRHPGWGASHGDGEHVIFSGDPSLPP